MKTNFASLKNKYNSHANVVRALEGQLSLHATQLEPRTATKDDGRQLTMVTSGRKICIRNAL